MGKKRKKEALTTSRFINEFLVKELLIPINNIVNDTTFPKFTQVDRPDLLISDIAYDVEEENDIKYIANLIAYAEVKDVSCKVDDRDWKDAYRQAKKKAKKLRINYFIVSNLKVSYFYNSSNGKELCLNNNPIREFVSLDVLRLIKSRVDKDKNITNIITNVDTQTSISEAVFNMKLWELANIYRGIDFKNASEKIDFTVGFIALKFFEEKEIIDNHKDASKTYWSDIIKADKNDTFISSLDGYIQRLERETTFNEFKSLMEIVRKKITKGTGDSDNKENTIDATDVKEIYLLIDSMNELHASGFDLFGAVYEKFASNKEKSDFGEFFTRRHYTNVFTKILLKNEKYFDSNKKIKILDPACGTGGFLTEAFKTLKANYLNSGTLTKDAEKFLKSECFYGFDIKQENISRSKLNMFLVGDGHTLLEKKDTLKEISKDNYGEFDYILTNPPYGNGIVNAETSLITTKRYEIAFIAKIINLLKVGGSACIITPEGVLENPTYYKFRKELLEKCSIKEIISLPKFAFAPYTKWKTYALFIEKRSDKETSFQEDDIWMYIIDNDGFANSDKRFSTKLKNENNQYIHDEISSWIDLNGDEHKGLLEERNLKYYDSDKEPTEWIDEKGMMLKKRKAEFIQIKDICKKNYYNLLPEYYLRPYEPKYISMDDFKSSLDNIENMIIGMVK